MIVELHILQNFAPANLNRDDTGSPKDCVFGGHRRARISSQCFKRAIRTEFKSAGLIDPRNLAERTKRTIEEVARRLAARGRPEAAARAVAITLVNEIGLKVVKEDKTEYLLFLAESEIAALADACLHYWDVLSAATQAQSARSDAPRAAKAKAEALPQEIKGELMKRFDGGRAADLALFGRMIANLPEKNVDGSCQVAHALSTNKVDVEFDFYTAVDDLKPGDTAGADMLGTVEFNSACFYRYANVDSRQLFDNLGGDAELARRTLDAFLRASVSAIPTGKQNSMAAHNPPSLVMIVVRDRGAWNLANAFLKPIRPERDGDLIQESIAALDIYWGKLATMYGADGHRVWLATTDPQRLNGLASSRRPSVAQAITEALAAVPFHRA